MYSLVWSANPGLYLSQLVVCVRLFCFAVLQIFELVYVHVAAITSATRQQISAWSLRLQLEPRVVKFIDVYCRGIFIVFALSFVIHAAEEGCVRPATPGFASSLRAPSKCVC